MPYFYVQKYGIIIINTIFIYDTLIGGKKNEKTAFKFANDFYVLL